MPTIPYSVSLDDIDASRDELEALRDVMRRDAPFPDEPPTLDDFAPPSDEDEQWWAAQGDPLADAGPPEWTDLDLEPLPELTISGSWDLPNGQFGHVREEPS